jgi:excisionase family DNA binding protein
MERTELELADMLDAEQLGRVLGVDRRTIYKWTRDADLPSVKISRRCLRFEKQAVYAWLVEHRAL